MMINSWRRWLLMSIITLIALTASVAVQNGQTRFFELVLTGKKIAGTYDSVSALDVIRCSALCTTKGSWLFTWDVETSDCSILNPLNAVPDIIEDSSTQSLKTYFITSINKKKVIMLPVPNTWTECKAECENLGGRIFLTPDSTYGAILHAIHGVNEFHLGIYRSPDDADTWYNMDGQVLSPLPLDWHDGEPNNGGGIQYYMSLWNGKLSDIYGTTDLRCTCEI